jgi:hypothetical protein
MYEQAHVIHLHLDVIFDFQPLLLMHLLDNQDNVQVHQLLLKYVQVHLDPEKFNLKFSINQQDQ